jgi:hypothetical protein
VLTCRRIILVNVVIGAVAGIAWYFDDSIYLRFVLIFLGTINALYAIFDIYLDGIKYAKIAQSDATLMAQQFNAQRDVRTSVLLIGIS